MARKNKKEENQRVLFSRLQKVWTDISHGEWVALLAELAPASMFKTRKVHIEGRCPFHEDGTPSFKITPTEGIAFCFGCKKSFWNPVHLVAALQNSTYGDAILLLRKRFGLKASIPEALYEKVRDHEIYQRHKAAFMQLSSMTLFQALTAYANGSLEAEGLSWAEPTIEYLLSRRLGENAPHEVVPPDERPDGTFDQYGIWSAICGQQLLGIFPPKAVVENQFGTTSEEFRFFTSYFSECLEGFRHVGWLVFPLNDIPGSVCRFKIRSASAEDKQVQFLPDAYEAEMGGFRGFYGLTYYSTYLTNSETRDAGGGTAVLHEGEFDALASIAQHIRRTYDDFIALGLGGAAAQSIDRLLQLGIKKAWVMPDRDRGGLNFTRGVFENTKAKELSLRVFRWPDEYVNWHDPTRPEKRIKDPDDAVKEIGYPRWRRYVMSADNYWQPHEWCYDQAVTEISRVDQNDIQQINRIAKEWGGLLRDEQACGLFCDTVARNYGLDAILLKRDIRAKDETEETYIERIHATALRDKFHPVGIQNAEGRKRLLTLWNKENRTSDTVVLNDERSAETLIARYYGPVYEFIDNYVGAPEFLTGGDEGLDTAFNVTTRSKKYREYLTYAMLKMAQNLPVMDHAPTKAQGIHMVEHSPDHMRSYMVNGRDVWRVDHAGQSCKIIPLAGPSDEGTIFDNSGESWISTLTDPKVFEEKVDIVDLYLRIRSIVETGWGFRHQTLDTTFLAAHIMCLSVMSLFTRQTAIILNAEASAGKSKFTAGLIGGTGYPRINIVAHAYAMQGYTAAAIRQKFNNSSLCLCAEEFEDYGNNDAKSMVVRKVLELLRDLISESPVNWSIGTTSGESRTYKLRFPLVASSIRPLRDAASLSRFIQFELVKDDRRGDPVIALLDKFGAPLMERTRHQLVVGMLPHMLALRNCQSEIEREYVTGSKLPAHASSRFREALYPCMSMLKLLSQKAQEQGRASAIPDYRAFAYDFSDSRKEQLARLKTTSENEQIFETLLSSAIQIAVVGSSEQMSGITTLRVMLGDLNNLDNINKTKKGVYLDKRMEWLVVNWVEAMQGLLAQTKYRGETPTFLKTVSERSPYYVDTKEVVNARVLERLVDAMGPCQPLALITVFSVKHILDAARSRQVEAAVPKAVSEKKPVEVPPSVPVKAVNDDDIVI